MLWGLCLTKSVFRGVYGFKLPEIDFLLLRLCVLQSFHYTTQKNSELASGKHCTSYYIVVARTGISFCFELVQGTTTFKSRRDSQHDILALCLNIFAKQRCSNFVSKLMQRS